MLAAATVTAIALALLQVSLAGDAAELESSRNIFLDRVLDLVQFVLGLEEIAGDRIFEERIALFLEIGDFLAVQRLAAVLFFMERLAFGIDGVKLGPGEVVRQKRVNPVADRGPFGLRDDGFAKFARFFFDDRRHNFTDLY